MTTQTANSSTLGYAAFAITLWMASMLNADWFSAAPAHMNMMLAFTVGGTAMALAGLMEYGRGRTLDMLIFLGFAAFWWSWALHSFSAGNGNMPPTDGGYMGWFFLMWAVFACWIWLGSMHAGALRNLFTLGLWLTMLALAIADWSGIDGFTILGGYLGLITALIAGYISAAETINEGTGHVVLSLGERRELRDQRDPQQHGTAAHA